MITDDDVKKLSKVFATKDDLKGLAKQKDLIETKQTVLQVKQQLNELSEYVVPALGNIFRWTDDIHRAVVGRSPRKNAS